MRAAPTTSIYASEGVGEGQKSSRGSGAVTSSANFAKIEGPMLFAKHPVVMSACATTSATFAVRISIVDPRYFNNAIASSASTPPVIEIGANDALAATSALDSMI